MVAIGIPQRAAIRAAEPETNNERNVISTILGSTEKERIKSSNIFIGSLNPMSIDLDNGYLCIVVGIHTIHCLP